MGYSRGTTWTHNMGPSHRCNICQHVFVDREEYWQMYNYHKDEYIKRCEPCYKKVKSTGKRPKRPDYTFGELMKYRKQAELNYKMQHGSEGEGSTTWEFIQNPHKKAMEAYSRWYSRSYSNALNSLTGCVIYFKPFLPKLSKAMLVRMTKDHRENVDKKMHEREKYQGWLAEASRTDRLFPLAEDKYKKVARKVVERKLKAVLAMEKDHDGYGNRKDDKAHNITTLTVKIDIGSCGKGLQAKGYFSTW